jgi:Reverse transcriptase (RNA-dependent DNA polymerase)
VGLPRVQSRLVRDAWQYYLRDYPDQHFVNSLLHIIDFGADLGFTGTHLAQSCRNLKSANDFPEFISNAVSDLLSSNHALGPFAAPPCSNFRSSPLGSVTRPRKPLKRRLINHLSWPHGSSVNDGIPDSEGHIRYEAFDQAVAAVASSGRGTLLAKLDLKEAFHHIPVRPTDWPLLGFAWQGSFYHAIVLIFGIKSAPYIFNLFAEALHWIIQRHIPAQLKHYLDDFLPIFQPSTPLPIANKAVDWIEALGTSLGLSFQHEKTLRPSTQTEYLGLELDTVAMEARLPADKLLYLRDLLQLWTDRRHCSLRDLQQLIGFLQFCSQVIPHSRAFLRRLISFSMTFCSQYSVRYLPAYAQAEIRWWRTYALAWNGVRIIIPSYHVLHVFTDASGRKGIGGIFEDEWFSSRVPRRFRNRDIQFKEIYAVLQAILRWGHRWKHCHVLFHVDNQVDVHALENDTNRSLHVMSILRLIVMLAAQLEFSYSSSWLSSSENVLADCASRYMYARLFELAPSLNRQPTSPHPPTTGIKRILTCQDSQRSGSGTGSPQALGHPTARAINPSSNLSSATRTFATPQAPYCLPPVLRYSNGLPTSGPAPSSQRPLNPTSPTFVPHTSTAISLSRPVNHRCSSAWSAELKGTWARRAESPSSRSPSRSSVRLCLSTRPPPALAPLTTLPPSASQFLPSYAAVNSQFAPQNPSTQPHTSLAAQSASSPHSLPPTTSSSPFHPQRRTPSERAYPSLSQRHRGPRRAQLQASNNSICLTPGLRNLHYSLATTASPSSVVTLSGGSAKTCLP